MSIFNYYPYILYNNNKSTHLLEKTEVIRDYVKDYRRFYTYVVKEGERADIVAYNEYGDPTLDWIIYLINNIVDPYKDWVMDDRTFRLYLEDKYNTSIERLSSRFIDSSIVHYYYKGLPSDTQEEIESYNYTMSVETFNLKAAENPTSVTGWEPLTVWQYESEINESKREIRLLRDIYINEFKQQFKDLMNVQS